MWYFLKGVKDRRRRTHAPWTLSDHENVITNSCTFKFRYDSLGTVKNDMGKHQWIENETPERHEAKTCNPDRCRGTISEGKLARPLSAGPTLAGRHMPGGNGAENRAADQCSDGLRDDISCGLGLRSRHFMMIAANVCASHRRMTWHTHIAL